MGCCTGLNRNINRDIIIESEDKNKTNEVINIKSPNIDFQTNQKTDKEEVKKEKPTNEPNNQKIEKEDAKNGKNLEIHNSAKNHEKISENTLKVNKKKVFKKGSHRVQMALKELKMLSLEEVESNKRYFN